MRQYAGSLYADHALSCNLIACHFIARHRPDAAFLSFQTSAAAVKSPE